MSPAYSLFCVWPPVSTRFCTMREIKLRRGTLTHTARVKVWNFSPMALRCRSGRAPATRISYSSSSSSSVLAFLGFAPVCPRTRVYFPSRSLSDATCLPFFRGCARRLCLQDAPARFTTGGLRFLDRNCLSYGYGIV